jgi:hypothetical protein
MRRRESSSCTSDIAATYIEAKAGFHVDDDADGPVQDRDGQILAAATHFERTPINAPRILARLAPLKLARVRLEDLPEILGLC